MKILFAILILISTNSVACGEGGVDPNREPYPIFLMEPRFGVGLESGLKRGTAVVILNLSKEGKVEKVLLVQITPESMPHKPIITALQRSKFSPNVTDGKATRSDEFEFVWEFDIISPPKIDLILPKF